MAHSGDSGKSYWKLLNSVLNKSRILSISLLLDNGLFVTCYKEKAQVFNNCFIRQYTTTNASYSVQHNPQVVSNPLNDFVMMKKYLI